MSCMACHLCDRIVDTDDDPEGFYTEKYPDYFICESCRESDELSSHSEPDPDLLREQRDENRRMMKEDLHYD